MTENTDLEGATVQPPEGIRVSNAGEFAASWNATTEESRAEYVAWWRDISDRAVTCFTQDHVGRIDDLQNRLTRASEKLRAIAESPVSTPVPTYEEFVALIIVERQRRPYSIEHDDEMGLRHLLNWAIDYARRGEAVKSARIIVDALSMVDRMKAGIR